MVGPDWGHDPRKVCTGCHHPHDGTRLGVTTPSWGKNRVTTHGGVGPGSRPHGGTGLGVAAQNESRTTGPAHPHRRSIFQRFHSKTKPSAQRYNVESPVVHVRESNMHVGLGSRPPRRDTTGSTGWGGKKTQHGNSKDLPVSFYCDLIGRNGSRNSVGR